MKDWFYWALSYAFRAFIIVTIGCTLLHNYQMLQRYFQTWHQPAGKQGLMLDNVMWADACNASHSQCVKDVLLVRGAIAVNTYFSLRQLSRQKTVQAICFDSPGGMALMMVVIARWINTNNLNTCVAEQYQLHDFPLKLAQTQCMSACPLVLASGRERWSLGQSIPIGVHQASAELSWCFCDLSLTAGPLEAIYQSLMPAGTANIKLIFEMSDQAPPAKMLLLTRPDLNAVNMFTQWL